MKKAVIAWGRFNPPTSGHEKLVNKVTSVARRSRAEPRLYLSHTQNPKKDPLQYKDKIAMAKKAFGSVIKQSTSRTIIQLMQELERAGFTEITMVAGSDRVNEYKTLLNNYNGKDYNFDSIKVVSAGERDPDAEGAAGMSATKLRKAAIEGDEQTFMSGVPSKLSKRDAEKLYTLIRKGMMVEELLQYVKENKDMYNIDENSFTDDELDQEVAEFEDDDLDEDVTEEDDLLERAPLTIRQRIAKSRQMKRLAPKLKRMRQVKKFRVAPTERLMMRARKMARNLFRKRFAGKKGEEYVKLKPSEKINIDRLIATKTPAIEKLAKRLLPKVRKAEIERVRAARTTKNETIERFDDVYEALFEATKTRQDPDIRDREGTQPARYHSGLAKSTKAARDAHFKKGAKMDDNNPAAYKPAPGDKEAETRPSKWTKKYKDLFGEQDALARARDTIKREKEADKIKHDRLLDRARTRDAQSSVRKAGQQNRGVSSSVSEALELSEKSMDALKKKAEKSGYSYGTLKKVYDRGVAAWRTGHRPGTTPQQWGYARVNAFIAKQKSGKKLDHDTDLANEYIHESYSNWTNQEPIEYAKHLSKTFGQPDEMTDSQLCWFAKDGFKRIVVKDEYILHGSPAPHYDFIYCYVDIAVPEKYARALADSSGSIIIDYLKGEVGARCSSLTANACTLNYVLDVVAERVVPSKAEYERRILEMSRMFESGKRWSVDWWPDSTKDADPKNEFYAEGNSRFCGCIIEEANEGAGLWHNIHKKRREGRPMRKPYSKGAPTKQDFKNASEDLKNYKQLIDEGVNDPSIFKAVFLAGGPGSGKSFIVGKTALTSLGMKVINSDDVFERALAKANLDPTPENIYSPAGQEIRRGAKILTKKKLDLALAGRLGLVIDGTGKDFDKIMKQAIALRKLGYDTAMIFVNTDEETALKRNRMRSRTLPDDTVSKMWKDVQKNLGKYQVFFGSSMFIVDNSESSDVMSQTNNIYRKIAGWSRKTPNNSAVKNWVKSQKAVNESKIDELSLSVKDITKSGINKVLTKDNDKLKKELERLRKGLKKEEAPVIDGKKMHRLGSKPGSYKALVKRHLGARAAEKIDKSDGNKLVAKGKRTGNQDLVRKGSFIKNVIAKEENQLDESLKVQETGLGTFLTAADLGIKMKSGYSSHPSVEEEHGAGEEGTDKLVKKYKKDTPGQ